MLEFEEKYGHLAGGLPVFSETLPVLPVKMFTGNRKSELPVILKLPVIFKITGNFPARSRYAILSVSFGYIAELYHFPVLIH